MEVSERFGLDQRPWEPFREGAERAGPSAPGLPTGGGWAHLGRQGRGMAMAV